ncbi:MAG: hypothetical protein IJE78_00475 [Bacteroidaceae bacterium]|nr:hypothetical protein [Bacteroidaceae bacterium]MBQ2855588.1 hypothetical protein [Bacteroidaceae bacterium]
MEGISDTEDLASIIASIEQQIAAKQDKLVSGTNIKTINGESILGEGNIVIEGGSGGSSSGGAYAEVNHGTSDTTFTLTPNTFHVWDEVATLDLSFGAETSGVANEYLFQFTSGATATTLTLPSDIKWANDTAPTIAENMIYQISVLKGLASVLEFSNEVSVFPATLVNGANGDLGVKVYDELHEIAQGGSGTLPSGDLIFVVGGNNISVTSFFYISSPYSGYVIYDTGVEYYILQANGYVTYYFYD